jgi:hypothetical protein
MLKLIESRHMDTSRSTENFGSEPVTSKIEVMDVHLYFSSRSDAYPLTEPKETWPNMESEGKERGWEKIVWGETSLDK